MIKALRAKPSLVFLLYAGNIALYVFLLLRGARGSGVFISALMAFVGLVFLYLCIKSGFVLAQGGRRESVDSTPRAFWASMAFVFVWYVVVTLFAVALYIQDQVRGIIP
jgi:hypothetical protein